MRGVSVFLLVWGDFGFFGRILSSTNFRSTYKSELEKIMSLLKMEDAKKLKHDLKLAPARISYFVIKNFFNQKSNKRR
jgi:hypothetical protein